MIDTPARTPTAHSAFVVLTALAELGEATAAAIAEHTDLGYSTVTPKLRAWEAGGHAERFRNDASQTLWRLTANGHAAIASSHLHTDPAPPPPPEPHHADGETVVNASSAHADAGTAAENTMAAEGVPADSRAHDDANPDEHDDAGRPGAAPQQSSRAEATGPVTTSENATSPQDSAGHRFGDHGEPDTDPVLTEPGDGTGTEAGQPAAPVTPTRSVSATSPAEPAGGDGAPSRHATPPTGADNHDGKQLSTTASDDRRPSGSLRKAIFDILEANPGHSYKVSELCKLIDRANDATSARKASAGAVANAAHKLVGTGRAVLLADKPATFALLRTDA